ncbi:MAG: nucleotidyltransferase domain-containing protein [Candidatus Woesearchaeota archaeon]|jgi:predicted nucleotidyltransferase|nr:nucleotidyltransferase domain-containing protein [Candidatus Woesearchaeota archaeon]
MNKYKLKFTKLQNEIFRLLCIKAGKELNQRQIARLLNVSPTAIQKALPLMEKEGVIKVVKDKGINLKIILLDHHALVHKMLDNLSQILDSGLVEELEELYPGCAIILFGSYARGEDTIDSDIDIAVITPKQKNLELTHFEQILEREIRVQTYPSFEGLSEEMKKSIMNGIVLGGSL